MEGHLNSENMLIGKNKLYDKTTNKRKIHSLNNSIVVQPVKIMKENIMEYGSINEFKPIFESRYNTFGQLDGSNMNTDINTPTMMNTNKKNTESNEKGSPRKADTSFNSYKETNQDKISDK